jgi:diguanylate cyclase (GGDEF)-like protein/PAS domain S-box-containing protein
MIGRRSLEFIHPDDQGLAIENWMNLLADSSQTRRVRLRHLARDGAWVWFEMVQTSYLDGEDRHVMAEMVDISKEMAAQETLQARERLLHRLAQALPLGVFHTDAAGNILFANDRLYEIVGLPPEETLLDQLALAADRAQLESDLRKVFHGAGDRDLELSLNLPAGQTRLCHVSLRALTGADTTVLGAVGSISDITESAALRRQLEVQATRDPLTGCLNRRALMTRLDEALRRAAAGRDGGVAVVFIDLDRFKHVNDQYGHAAGDELLVVVADRLRSWCGERDALGRIGGDEFIVVREAVADPDEARRLRDEVTELLAAEAVLAAGVVPVTASVGAAWTEGGEDADALVASADASMYRRKRSRPQQPASVPAPRSAEESLPARSE